ncbi:AcrR family transcriptional regulator [Nocardioides sp. BE266]|uniref:TetR/AcrR family transcriptional regulator n=1 Tax=Nocardioides sp. BE266 TaxID=2817725 RepID=UPI00285F1312|nr:TetR/AcrR family transcriptional regulator [Nocardioides sp. BE266]MDR7255814.1 AcrR family transcriptional regulator [Nocardioides sp. BE266]
MLLTMDSEQRYIPRSGAMFSGRSLARAEMATDLAIPIVAEGGWSALTLRSVADAANVTPQAIAAWFPSVGAMRVAVASRYGDRWIGERGYLARRRTLLPSPSSETLAVSDLVVALLPQSWLEEVYDGIWLTIVEAGRWDDGIAPTVDAVHGRERDLVRDLLEQPGRYGASPGEVDAQALEQQVELVLGVVRGMRASHVPSRAGMTAHRAGTLLTALGQTGCTITSG